MAIRWKPNEVESIARLIENYNRRVRRMNSKNNLYIPTIKKPKTTLKNMKNRAELNRLLRDLESARYNSEIVEVKRNKADAEKLGKIELRRFQKKDIERRVALINKQRKQRSDAIRALLGDVDEGDRPAMRRILENELNPKKKLSQVAAKDFQKYAESVYKQSQPDYYKWRDSLYMKNYKETFAKYYPDRIDELEDILKKIPLEKQVIYSVVYEALYLEFIYPNSVEAAIKGQMIIDAWNIVASGGKL